MAFTYKNIHASEMYLCLTNEQQFNSTTRDREFVKIPGRDGDLIIDNGRFNSNNLKFPCIIKPPLTSSNINIENLVSKINKWLTDDKGFQNLLIDSDPEFVYKATIENAITTNRIISHLGKAVITFRVHPIKYLINSLDERIIPSGTTIFNTFSVDAKPKITIQGSGNMNISIGGRQLILNNIPGGCIIDSETQTLTNLNGTVTLFHLMRSAFPILTSGDNLITFSNNITRFSIETRLGELI